MDPFLARLKSLGVPTEFHADLKKHRKKVKNRWAAGTSTRKRNESIRQGQIRLKRAETDALASRQQATRLAAQTERDRALLFRQLWAPISCRLPAHVQ